MGEVIAGVSSYLVHSETAYIEAVATMKKMPGIGV